ncbi:FLYWCH zinc finger domain-containing protein [Phthorimaea operculella]|nr:FLYWCH zinc finger domain-containing protein [Phthorimaea operculella]
MRGAYRYARTRNVKIHKQRYVTRFTTSQIKDQYSPLHKLGTLRLFNSVGIYAAGTRGASASNTRIHIPDRGDTDMPAIEDDHHDHYDDYMMTECPIETPNKTGAKETKSLETQIQYTISNQGALQMILNRYMYYLRYTSRKEQHGHRSWKCINYTKKGTVCPATVITRDDVVIKRFGAHNHPFHDKQILKKVRDNAVFSAINEAELKGHAKKVEHGREPVKTHHGDTTDAE